MSDTKGKLSKDINVKIDMDTYNNIQNDIKLGNAENTSQVVRNALNFYFENNDKDMQQNTLKSIITKLGERDRENYQIISDHLQSDYDQFIVSYALGQAKKVIEEKN